MLSKQEANELFVVEWLVKNPGKRMAFCAPSQKQAEALVESVKDRLKAVGEVKSKPCVINGKPTKDLTVWLVKS